MSRLNSGGSKPPFKIASHSKTLNTVGPPYPRALHPRIQPITAQNYSGKKKSREYQQAKLEFAVVQQLFIKHLHGIYNYLHSIYIALGIIHIREDMPYVICKYYDILYKGIEHPWILVFERAPGANTLWLLRGDCTLRVSGGDILYFSHTSNIIYYNSGQIIDALQMSDGSKQMLVSSVPSLPFY